MKAVKIISWGIIIASFILAIALYPSMPSMMASHWNSSGEVDDYLPKAWGLFLMPTMSLLIYLLLAFLPRIDPIKENVKKNKKYYEGFLLLFVVFMFYLFIVMVLANYGIIVNMQYMLAPAFFVLFYYLGVMMSHLKRNWFIGIRNPWTISNDKVWDKTHKLGGKLFKIEAFVFILAFIWPQKLFLIILVQFFAAIIYLFVYSYIEYKKLKK